MLDELGTGYDLKLAFLIALALVPALLNGLWSRGLLRRLEAADLAERLWRHRIRVIQVNTLGLVTVILAAGRHALWLGPLLLVTSLAAGFRLRRTLFEESWAFAAYLGFLTPSGAIGVLGWSGTEVVLGLYH